MRTILVTYLSAVHAISRARLDRDARILLAEGARDRALQLIDRAERRVPYVEGSVLDRAIRDARRRIEQATIDDA